MVRAFGLVSGADRTRVASAAWFPVALHDQAAPGKTERVASPPEHSATLECQLPLRRDARVCERQRGAPVLRFVHGRTRQRSCSPTRGKPLTQEILAIMNNPQSDQRTSSPAASQSSATEHVAPPASPTAGPGFWASLRGLFASLWNVVYGLLSGMQKLTGGGGGGGGGGGHHGAAGGRGSGRDDTRARGDRDKEPKSSEAFAQKKPAREGGERAASKQNTQQPRDSKPGRRGRKAGSTAAPDTAHAFDDANIAEEAPLGAPDAAVAAHMDTDLSNAAPLGLDDLAPIDLPKAGEIVPPGEEDVASSPGQAASGSASGQGDGQRGDRQHGSGTDFDSPLTEELQRKVRKFNRSKVCQGTVIAHGAHPYPKMGGWEPGTNYFVLLRLDNGEEAAVWGKQLRAPMQDADVKPLDRVEVRRTDIQPLPGRNGGKQWKRNVFEVTVLDSPTQAAGNNPAKAHRPGS